MNYYFITGTSSGIGKALVENLIQKEENCIAGYARRNKIEHNQYCHQIIDLSDLEAVEKITFPTVKTPNRIVLINNAGTLGEIKHFGDMQAAEIVQVLNVNMTALAILCNAFINAYQNVDCKKVIVNISSGAATSPYDGWASYCASKAGVDMLTKVMDKEQEKKSRPIECFAIAPGVVDTYMQEMIRESNDKDFSRIEKFHELKSTGKLYGADAVAEKLVSWIENTNQIPDLISRVQL